MQMKSKLADLLISTKDGDWGNTSPMEGYLPYHVIRGADFPKVRSGDVSSVPVCYLDEKTVNRRTLEPNDIIIETAGGNRGRPTGRTLLITQNVLKRFDLPVTCASFSRFLRVDPAKADPEFIFWYLQYLYSRGEMWEYQVQHTGVARFQYTVFANTIEIPLPSFPTQHAIARILGSLDDKIELNRQMNETLEAMARAIFQSWFVDFDPVRAKAEGCDTGLPPEVAALFPSEIVDVDGREVPKGWGVGTIGESTTIVGGSTPSTTNSSFWENGTHPFATPKDLAGLSTPILLDTEKKITDLGVDQISSRILPLGTVLLSSRAPIGYIALTTIPVSINQGFIAVICDRALPNYYVLSWVRENLPLIVDRANGTTFLEISKSNFKPMDVLIPPAEVLTKFVQQVEPHYAQIGNNEQQSRTLAQIRDALLPKLMSRGIQLSP